MLLFYNTSLKELDTIQKQGIAGPVALYKSLDDAEAKGGELILVIHGFRVEGQIIEEKKKKVLASTIALDAILNINPYLQPCKVVAGGGYVIRYGENEREVLMIYRKGLWDLPKGKLDEGESIEECALREVREEVGIKALVSKKELGKTVHGYSRNNKYKVKTTHWYHMETPEEKFKPQTEEDIEEVKWVPWSEAVDCIGYEVFRRHMTEIEGQLAG